MSLPQTKLRDTFERLRSNPKEVFLLDGGTGEELFRRQVPDDRKIWSATALVHEQYHTILEDVHTDFLESGSDAITTNSYGVCPGVGFDSDDISKYIAIAGKIARRATQKSSGTNKYVLGSLGPLVESYRPDKIMSHEDGVKNYMRACSSLAPHTDAFIAETMSCVEESIQVLDAVARSNDDDIDKLTGQQQCSLLISYTLDPNGNFRDGEEVLNGIRRLLEHAEKKRENVQCKIFTILNSNFLFTECGYFGLLRSLLTFFYTVLAILFNCSEPEAISKALEGVHSDSELLKILNDRSILLGAYANRLTQVVPNWILADSEAPQPLRNDLDEKRYWEDFVKVWIDRLGVQIIGGCCGITPEHIRYIRAELDKR